MGRKAQSSLGPDMLHPACSPIAVEIEPALGRISKVALMKS